jgi:hypothetical protein
MVCAAMSLFAPGSFASLRGRRDERERESVCVCVCVPHALGVVTNDGTVGMSRNVGTRFDETRRD